ncbi:hypothetical protein QBC39DRAFT_438323 [Podospora conica]|nr:hypothetical protein QBC39DRAFT_438323 [Schizothecium conicum]
MPSKHPAFSISCEHTDAAFLSQPVLRALRPYLDAFNAKNYAVLPDFHTPDFVFVGPAGEATAGRDAALAAMTAGVAVFADYRCEVRSLTGAPTGEGTLRFVSTEKLFADFAGGEGERKYTDLAGRGWDVVGEAAWVFDVVEEEVGGKVEYKVKRTQVFADSMPILKEAVLRGVVSLESLVG